MLLSLCTYSVIIKMIDRNLSEVIDPSHYYLWDLVLLILYKISFLTKERFFFRRKDKWKILNIQTEYQLCTKKRKEKKKLRILLCHGEGHFFFFFWAKQRLLLKEQTKIQRQHPPTKHEHFWQTKSLDMDKPND